MDSLLSNSQRCTRKAESLIACGLFDEALVQLDKSIDYLLELKAATARLDTNQFLREQIEALDRKKRLVAIKRAESIRKKNQLEALINKSKELQSLQAVVIQPNSSHNHQTKFRHGSKLSKDEKCVLEELSTSNAEFKKVNAYLANEIEELKKENEFLKVELIKAKLSDDESTDQQPPSLSHHRQRTATTNTTAPLTTTVNTSLPHEIQALNQHTDDDEDDDDDDIAIVESLKDAGSQTVDALEIRINSAASAHSNTSPANTTSSSSHSSSSMTVSSSQTSSSATTNSSSLNDISSSTGTAAVVSGTGVTTEFYKGSQQSLLNMTRVRRELLLPVQQLSSPQFKQTNRVDLSQYINEEDDDDDDDVEVSHNLDDSDYACNQGHGAIHSPPNEFTID